MEIVQEEHCSQGVVRLTCRSLKAFIFVLEAEHLANLTHICGYETRKTVEAKVNRGSMALKSMELRGNYVEDAEEAFGVVDIRKSLNRK